jgi:hypothetical protein
MWLTAPGALLSPPNRKAAPIFRRKTTMSSTPKPNPNPNNSSNIVSPLATLSPAAIDSVANAPAPAAHSGTANDNENSATIHSVIVVDRAKLNQLTQQTQSATARVCPACGAPSDCMNCLAVGAHASALQTMQQSIPDDMPAFPKQIADAVERHEDELNNERMRHEDELNNMSELGEPVRQLEATDAIAALKSDMAAMNAAMQAHTQKHKTLMEKHDTDMQTMMEKHDTDMQTMMEKHDSDMQTMMEKHDTDMQTLKETLMEKHNADMQTLTEKHDTDMQTLTAMHNTEMQTMTNRVEELTNYVGQLEMDKATLQQEVHRLKTDNENRVNSRKKFRVS